MTAKKSKPEKVDLEPDAWDRFQRTIDQIAPPKRPKKGNVDKQGAHDKPDRPNRI